MGKQREAREPLRFGGIVVIVADMAVSRGADLTPFKRLITSSNG